MHLTLLWFVLHIFFSMVLQVWCMNFYKIVLFQMYLQVVSTFFWGMWGHYSRSCSTFNIPIFFCISTLKLKKQFRSIRPIAFGEVTYHLVTYTIAIQFRDIFAKHFNPHQFGVVTHDGCKIVVHGVLTMLNLHPN